MLAWQNNPAGICEDAPCCGCCGPHGDGAFDPDEPPDYDDYDDGREFDEDDDLCQHGYVGQGDCPQCEDEAAVYFEPSPDPDWMNP